MILQVFIAHTHSTFKVVVENVSEPLELIAGWSKQFNLSLICPQNILPVPLWSVNVLFRKLQACSNVLFSKQRLPSWCSAIDTLLVQGFTDCRLMNTDVSLYQWRLQIFGCHSALFLYLIDESPLCSWGHFDWAPTSRQSSHSPKLSPFVDCLPYCRLVNF